MSSTRYRARDRRGRRGQGIGDKKEDGTVREKRWQELNNSSDHRREVIESLDVVISTQIAEEHTEINRRAPAPKVQDAYSTSTNRAMKGYIDKVQSAQCQIETDEIMTHFGQSWLAGIDEFQEAGPESEFDLELRIVEQEGDEETVYMQDEKNIEAVIKSRQDLSASGVDRISYRITKGAKGKGVKFVSIFVNPSMRTGKIADS
jgi:hypothetical protein